MPARRQAAREARGAVMKKHARTRRAAREAKARCASAERCADGALRTAAADARLIDIFRPVRSRYAAGVKRKRKPDGERQMLCAPCHVINAAARAQTKEGVLAAAAAARETRRDAMRSAIAVIRSIHRPLMPPYLFRFSLTFSLAYASAAFFRCYATAMPWR